MFFSTVIVWWLSILMIEQPESVFGIIKGENATIEEFPWQVALFYKHSFICGAVIINKDWLLTAKNCILNEDGTELDPSNLRVFAGNNDLDNFECSTSNQGILVDETILYNSTVRESLDQDMGLIKLSTSLQLEPNRIEEAMFYDDSDQIEQFLKPLVTVGWGITNVNTLPPKFSSILQKTSLTDKTFCYHYEDDEDEVYHLIYGIGEQTSVCKGDSGSGLTINKDGKQYVIGITSGSYGDDCQGLNVFSRVSSYLNWMKENIKGPIHIGKAKHHINHIISE